MNKLAFIIAMALFLTPVFHFLEETVFTNAEFLICVGILVAIDTVLGIRNAYHNKSVSSKGFSKIITKLLVYLLAIIAANILSHYQVDGEKNVIFDWVDDGIYAMICIREFLSIMEKSSALGFNLLPKWMLKRLEMFDDEGNLK